MFTRSERGLDPIAFVEFELSPGQDLDLGIVQLGKRQSLADAPFDDTSDDLGMRFFSGPRPPTAAQLRQIGTASDPRALLETRGAKLWIASVAPGSPAERAGLRAGDSVVAVGRMEAFGGWSPQPGPHMTLYRHPLRPA